jgi:hypothetical protein
MCRLDSDRCVLLGDVLREQDPKAAAAAYDKAISNGLDAVAASHLSRWLVDYHLSIGDRAGAEAVARRGADTGSGAGMFALAWFHERTGDMPAAETLYRQIADRYDSRSALDQFLARRAVAKDAGFARKSADATARIFQLGVRAFDPGFTTAPLAYERVNSETAPSRAAGLHIGDAIVAIDGFAVDGPLQYDVLRLAGSGPLQLVFWCGKEKAYRKATIAHPVDRDLGVTTSWVGRSYTAPKAINGQTPDQWMAAVQNPSDPAHDRALETLLQFEYAAIPAVRRLLQDPDPAVRQPLYLRLQRWPASLLAVLSPDIFGAFTKEREGTARNEAFTLVGQLARYGYQPATDRLFAVLKESDPDRPLIAAQQLSMLGASARAALPDMKALLARQTDPMRRMGLERSIEILEKTQPQ